MSRKPVVSIALAFLLSAGSAPVFAQDAAPPPGEALPTSTDHGYVDLDAKVAPPGQGRTMTVPAPKSSAKSTLYKGPLDRLAEIPRNNFLTNVHGSVGVMVGSHNTRGAFANVHGPIGDNAAFGLNFSTIHSDAMPYYDGYAGGYGGGYGGYRGGLDDVYPSGAALGYNRRYGGGYGGDYGYGSGTSTTVGASLQLGGQNRYDRVWPNYVPPRREETTDVTDEPDSLSE
jgi:hypothetical protein